MAANALFRPRHRSAALGVVCGGADLEGAGAGQTPPRSHVSSTCAPCRRPRREDSVRALGTVHADAGFRSPSQPVHHLDRGREDPRGDDADTADRPLGRVENGQQRTRARAGAERSVTSVTMPSVPSGPTTTPSSRSRHRPGRPHYVTVGQHDLGAEHVVDRDAVFQAVRPAGVLGHVAADRAHLLAGGIGRVVEAAAAPTSVTWRFTTPGWTLRAGCPDRSRARGPCARGRRPCPPRQAAPPERPVPAPRHERNPVRSASTNDGLHLLRGLGASRRARGSPFRPVSPSHSYVRSSSCSVSTAPSGSAASTASVNARGSPTRVSLCLWLRSVPGRRGSARGCR